MINDYIKENWDGWPLHSAVAGGFMIAGYYYPMEALLVANTVWWPDREATQHNGYKNIWTFHRIMEWGCPLLVGFGLYYYMRFQ